MIAFIEEDGELVRAQLGDSITHYAVPADLLYELVEVVSWPTERAISAPHTVNVGVPLHRVARARELLVELGVDVANTHRRLRS